MEGSFVSPCLLQNPETHLTASVFLEGEFRGRRPPTLLTPSSSQSLQCSGAFRGRLCGKNRHREGLSMCVLTIPLVTAHARSSSQDLLKLGSFRERERARHRTVLGHAYVWLWHEEQPAIAQISYCTVQPYFT